MTSQVSPGIYYLTAPGIYQVICNITIMAIVGAGFEGQVSGDPTFESDVTTVPFSTVMRILSTESVVTTFNVVLGSSPPIGPFNAPLYFRITNVGAAVAPGSSYSQLLINYVGAAA